MPNPKIASVVLTDELKVKQLAEVQRLDELKEAAAISYPPSPEINVFSKLDRAVVYEMIINAAHEHQFQD